MRMPSSSSESTVDKQLSVNNAPRRAKRHLMETTLRWTALKANCPDAAGNRRIADKWTMLVIMALEGDEASVLRVAPLNPGREREDAHRHASRARARRACDQDGLSDGSGHGRVPAHGTGQSLTDAVDAIRDWAYGICPRSSARGRNSRHGLPNVQSVCDAPGDCHLSDLDSTASPSYPPSGIGCSPRATIVLPSRRAASSAPRSRPAAFPRLSTADDRVPSAPSTPS